MSPKRSLSPVETIIGDAKRQKFSQQDGLDTEIELFHSHLSTRDLSGPDLEEHECQSQRFSARTRHHFARCGIQRSIAIVLRHDGFESASPEALESFTEMVETYLQSIIEETKRLAVASRRDHPIPLDFESMLERYNLSLASLKPHLRNLAATEEFAPSYADPSPSNGDTFISLPLLGEELSGQPDKKSKHYIPSSFPDFPSTHTYRFTPQEDSRVRDSKTIREEAARTAQQGEDALRRLVRASKMRKQKEVKSLVEKDGQGKERFRLWESTMRRFMDSEDRSKNAEQVEIADHSMIVNGDAIFSRQEPSRLSKRAGPLPSRTT